MPEKKKIKLSKSDSDSTMPKKIKVTLLSGFLGAGKTTLLKRILRLNNELSEDKRLKMAVIVNDMGEINLDADEIKSSKVVQEDAEMVEMHNGCICCTLRGDLLKTVKSLSEEGKYDYLVIESTGIGEPLPVAQTFTMDVDSMQASHGHDHSHEEEAPPAPGMPSLHVSNQLQVAQDEKKSLSHFATLDTLVTVIDALNIFDVLGSIDTLASKNNIAGMNGLTGALKETPKQDPMDADGNKTEATETDSSTDDSSKEESDDEQVDDRSVAQLLLDQIEFANVIVVSKASLLAKQQEEKKSKKGIHEIERLLHKLNPGAKVVVPQQDKYGDLDVSKELINTGLFDMQKAQESAGWIQELMNGGHTPETEEYGISSTLYKASEMPFHPVRLEKILSGFGSYGMAIKGGVDEEDEKERNGIFKGVVRAKGQLWLANANAYPFDFQTAGKNVNINPNGETFIAALPRGKWDEIEEELCIALKSKNDWNDRYGDRRSLLVFIGIGLNKKLIHEKLNEALLTEEESKKLGGMSGWKKLDDPFFGGQSKMYFEYQE